MRNCFQLCYSTGPAASGEDVTDHRVPPAERPLSPSSLPFRVGYRHKQRGRRVGVHESEGDAATGTAANAADHAGGRDHLWQLGVGSRTRIPRNVEELCAEGGKSPCAPVIGGAARWGGLYTGVLVVTRTPAEYITSVYTALVFLFRHEDLQTISPVL